MTEHGRAEATITILNEKGLHTRPSTELVKCASNFQSSITLKTESTVANAKSLLSILMLAATRGTEIVLEAEGLDADEAIEALKDLAENKFKMDY